MVVLGVMSPVLAAAILNPSMDAAALCLCLIWPVGA